MVLKTWNSIKAMGIGEEDGYWKWLGKFLKAAATWQRIKAVSTSPILEFFNGWAATVFFAVFGFWFGATDNRLYYLLLLGVIPGVLMMLHGEYRDQMRRREK